MDEVARKKRKEKKRLFQVFLAATMFNTSVYT